MLLSGFTATYWKCYLKRKFYYSQFLFSSYIHTHIYVCIHICICIYNCVNLFFSTLFFLCFNSLYKYIRVYLHIHIYIHISVCKCTDITLTGADTCVFNSLLLLSVLSLFFSCSFHHPYTLTDLCLQFSTSCLEF